MNEQQVREVALALPDAIEQDHHGFPSFRVRGKIFATLPDPDHLHVMLPEEGIRAAVAQWPDWCEEKWWGAKLAAARVTLTAADPAVVPELLSDAWRHKAPATLRRSHDSR